jgi:hypothetical protein
MDNVKVQCNGINSEDCYSCGKYYSSHSLHYHQILKEKVSEVSCSIGGHKTFNEDGEEIRGV